MAGLIRFLFPMVGFFCTATVITALFGYGYLRYEGTIDDEKVFRIMAILHDVDLEKIADTRKTDEFEVPPEEPSLEQRQEQMQVALLQIEAKKDDLARLSNEFESRRRRIEIASENYRNFKDEAKLFLDQIKKEAENEGLVAVRNQLQNMNAKKQAKPLLIDMIKAGRTLQVIQLLNGMSTRSRSDILKAFDSDQDLETLAKIQERMLEGDPIKPYVDKQLQELNQLGQEDVQ